MALYTKRLDEAEDRVGKILNELNYSSKIELQYDDDPDWTEYKAVLSGADEEG